MPRILKCTSLTTTKKCAKSIVYLGSHKHFKYQKLNLISLLSVFWVPSIDHEKKHVFKLVQCRVKRPLATDGASNISYTDKDPFYGFFPPVTPVIEHVSTVSVCE